MMDARAPSPDPRRRRFRVAKVGVSDLSFEDALDWLAEAPGRGERLSAHFINAHTIAEARRPSLQRALAQGDLVAPDGMPLVWAGRLQRRKVVRVCGPDMMPALIERSRARGARHFFYGGAPGVPERLAAAFAERFPGIEIAGAYAPPFRALSPEEQARDLAMMNAARPDYVWVGLGTPRQDYWVARYREEVEAPVLLAVGAAFNFHVGDLRRAPRWMQRSGLEWLFRLVMEPRRLWRRYVFLNAVFLLMVGLQATSALAHALAADVRGLPTSLTRMAQAAAHSSGHLRRRS